MLDYHIYNTEQPSDVYIRLSYTDQPSDVYIRLSYID